MKHQAISDQNCPDLNCSFQYIFGSGETLGPASILLPFLSLTLDVEVRELEQDYRNAGRNRFEKAGGAEEQHLTEQAPKL
jgi:hypothetical protein